MQQAKVVRLALKTMLQSLDTITDNLGKFSGILAEIRDPSDLGNLRKEIVAFKHKTQDDLNVFLTQVEEALGEWNKMITDSTFDAMRRACVEEIRKIRESSIEMLEKFRDPMDPKFLQDVPEDVNSIVSAKKSLHEVITVQLFQKIDKDVLGRIKIGSRLGQ